MIVGSAGGFTGFWCTDRYAVCGHLSEQMARNDFIGRGAFAHRWDHRCGGENASPSPAAADDFRFESKKIEQIFPPLQRQKIAQKTAETAGRTRIRGKRTTQRGSPGPKTPG